MNAEAEDVERKSGGQVCGSSRRRRLTKRRERVACTPVRLAMLQPKWIMVSTVLMRSSRATAGQSMVADAAIAIVPDDDDDDNGRHRDSRTVDSAQASRRRTNPCCDSANVSRRRISGARKRIMRSAHRSHSAQQSRPVATRESVKSSRVVRWCGRPLLLEISKVRRRWARMSGASEGRPMRRTL